MNNYPRAPMVCPCHPPPEKMIPKPIENLFQKFAIDSMYKQIEPTLQQMFPENTIPRNFREKNSQLKILYWMFRSTENCLHSEKFLPQQILALQQSQEIQERILVESHTFFFDPYPKIFSDAEIQNKLQDISYHERIFLDFLLRNFLTIVYNFSS